MVGEQPKTRSVETPAPAPAGNGSLTAKLTPAKVGKKAAKRAKASKGRRRGRKPYPVIPFEQALRFGQGVAEVGSGHPVKRGTLLEKLNLSVNQTTRELITASNRYGITTGSHTAEEFSVTADGAKAAELNPSPDRNRARIKLAINDIDLLCRKPKNPRGS